jgi:hypothetical protein
MLDNPMHTGAGFDDDLDIDEKRAAQDDKDYWQERLGLGGWADKGAQND